MFFGKNFEKCLNSIFSSTYSDFEIVVNDATRSPEVRDLLSKYDVRTITGNTRTLESRLLTVRHSTGETILLLDETRLVSSSLLGRIAGMPNKMIVVGESEMGGGILQKLTNLDKLASNLVEEGEISPLMNKSILPRIYDRTIIQNSFDRIVSVLEPQVFSEIVGLDLELIYLEAWHQTKDIGFIRTSEIHHFGETSYKDLFKKYYRYGRSQKILRKTPYADFASLRGRTRHGLSGAERLTTVPIQLLRGFPFVLGYISGS